MPNPRWYLHGGVCATAVTSLVGLATEETLALADLITVEHDVVPYIMDWPQIPADDGKPEAAVLVVLKRPGGFMAAVPIGFMPEEVLANGNMDPPPGVVYRAFNSFAASWYGDRKWSFDPPLDLSCRSL